MPNIILPVAKTIYVCDDVVRDPVSGKVSVLNIWETARVKQFPFVLGKLCVFAQFRGGLGEVPFCIEIAHADTGDLIPISARFIVSFKDRITRVDVKCNLTRVVFLSPGTYIVSMYCNEEFVDDQPIRVLLAQP